MTLNYNTIIVIFITNCYQRINSQSVLIRLHVISPIPLDVMFHLWYLQSTKSLMIFIAQFFS